MPRRFDSSIPDLGASGRRAVPPNPEVWQGQAPGGQAPYAIFVESKRIVTKITEKPWPAPFAVTPVTAPC